MDIINRIYHRSPIRTEKSHPEGKRIMPETRFTKFPAFSVEYSVGISRSALETDDRLFLSPMTLKIIIYHSTFLLFLAVDVA